MGHRLCDLVHLAGRHQGLFQRMDVNNPFLRGKGWGAMHFGHVRYILGPVSDAKDARGAQWACPSCIPQGVMQTLKPKPLTSSPRGCPCGRASSRCAMISCVLISCLEGCPSELHNSCPDQP